MQEKDINKSSNKVNKINFKDYNNLQLFDAETEIPSIPCIYVFEINNELVKCGMTSNIKNRIKGLNQIKRIRFENLDIFNLAILEVSEGKLSKAEKIFFNKLTKRQDNTELFAITFSNAVSVLNDLSNTKEYFEELFVKHTNKEQESNVSSEKSLLSEMLDHEKELFKIKNHLLETMLNRKDEIDLIKELDRDIVDIFVNWKINRMSYDETWICCEKDYDNVEFFETYKEAIISEISNAYNDLVRISSLICKLKYNDFSELSDIRMDFFKLYESVLYGYKLGSVRDDATATMIHYFVLKTTNVLMFVITKLNDTQKQIKDKESIIKKLFDKFSGILYHHIEILLSNLDKKKIEDKELFSDEIECSWVDVDEMIYKD